MKAIEKTTASNIKAWMAQRQVTGTMVAAAARRSVVMVSYVINGKRTSAPILNIIAALCRVTLAELLAGPAASGKLKEAA